MTLETDITELQVFKLMTGPDKEEVLAVVRKHDKGDVAGLQKVAQYVAELIAEIRLEESSPKEWHIQA